MIGFRLCSAGGTFSIMFAVLGVACAHLAMNLTDDYFDYKVDMLGDRDKVIRQGFRAMLVKYPYLTDGSETLKSTARAIAAFTLVALCCCGVILADRQETPVFAPMGLWWIGVIVLCCAFFGVFYSAPPVKLAYRGLGEPVIGIIFGPLVMMGGLLRVLRTDGPQCSIDKYSGGASGDEHPVYPQFHRDGGRGEGGLGSGA